MDYTIVTHDPDENNIIVYGDFEDFIEDFNTCVFDGEYRFMGCLATKQEYLVVLQHNKKTVSEGDPSNT